MKVTFYRNTSEPNAIQKAKITITTLNNVNMVDELNIIKPMVRVETNIISDAIGVALDMNEINYCYIHDIGRYYFITLINSMRTNVTEINLFIDVLNTYKEQIYACSGLINAAETGTNHNRYLTDPNYRIVTPTTLLHHEFTGGTTLTPKLIVVTQAGAVA